MQVWEVSVTVDFAHESAVAFFATTDVGFDAVDVGFEAVKVFEVQGHFFAGVF